MLRGHGEYEAHKTKALLPVLGRERARAGRAAPLDIGGTGARQVGERLNALRAIFYIPASCTDIQQSVLSKKERAGAAGAFEEGATVHELTHLMPVGKAVPRGAEIFNNKHTLAPHAFSVIVSLSFRYRFQRHKQAPRATQHPRHAARLRRSQGGYLCQLCAAAAASDSQLLASQN